MFFCSFLIYINDLRFCSSTLFLILFADDLNSVISANNIDDLIAASNNVLDILIKWYNIVIRFCLFVCNIFFSVCIFYLE